MESANHWIRESRGLMQRLIDTWNRFGNELVVAAGKGEPAAVMSNYGFK